MRQMGYCCGQKLSFTPLALFCYGQSGCVIARDQTYYLHESGPQYGCLKKKFFFDFLIIFKV